MRVSLDDDPTLWLLLFALGMTTVEDSQALRIQLLPYCILYMLAWQDPFTYLPGITCMQQSNTARYLAIYLPTYLPNYLGCLPASSTEELLRTRCGFPSPWTNHPLSVSSSSQSSQSSLSVQKFMPMIPRKI